MNSDFDDDDLEMDDTGFDDFDDGDKGGDGNTLGDLWRNSPLFKIGAIVGAIVIVIILFSLLGGKKEELSSSRLPSGPEVSSTPGETGSSQAYVEAVVDKNTERFETALNTGGSAIPTPIDARSAVLSLSSDNNDDGEDPLERWRRVQEQRRQQPVAVAPPEPTPEENAQRNESLQSLADIMAEQMQAILENSSEATVNSLTYTDPSYLEELRAQEEEEALAVAEAEAGTVDDAEIGEITLLPAGEIVYAQLITEANSDVPGPILATIPAGPLKGSRVLGGFDVAGNYLTLTFDTIVIDDISYSINAVALDPNTSLSGLATDVNHHYFQRIVLPAAAAFIEGAADAISESGLTTITISGDTATTDQQETDDEQEIASGISEAGSELSELLDDINDDIETTVIVAAGTPMGLLFTEAVTVPDTSIEE